MSVLKYKDPNTGDIKKVGAPKYDVYSKAQTDTLLQKKADKSIYVSVVLTSSGWDSNTKTQTVTVSGVLADESKQLIMPMPLLTSQASYIESGVLCTGQNTDSLIFTAENIPEVDLAVYVVIQEVSAT